MRTLITLKAMRLLGITIKRKGGRYEVYGVPPGGLFKPNKIMILVIQVQE